MIDPKMTSRLNLLRAVSPLSARALSRAAVLVLALSLLWPTASLAQDEGVEYDARLDGYETKVQVDGDSTALMWILLVALAAVALGVMFKNARRTHLD